MSYVIVMFSFLWYFSVAFVCVFTLAYYCIVCALTCCYLLTHRVHCINKFVYFYKSLIIKHFLERTATAVCCDYDVQVIMNRRLLLLLVMMMMMMMMMMSEFT